MTLSTNITLPVLMEEQFVTDSKQLHAYLKKLAYVVSTQVQLTNQTTNGFSAYYTDLLPPPWLQFIQGSTASGTATYTPSSFYVRAINLAVTVHFDIKWAAATGTGNLLITLPYFARNTVGAPYIGVIESDSMAFTAGYTYLTGSVLPNTNTIQINQNGSGLPNIPLAITPSGHLKGTITYVINSAVQ